MDIIPDSMQPRSCLSCSRTVHGRSDKKFCNDQCRNVFNNRLNSSANNYMRSIDNHLRRNRRILRDVLGGKRVAITRLQHLNSHGFVFSFGTHTLTSRNGNNYQFCYDYGYLLLPAGQVRIVYKPTLRSDYGKIEITAANI